MSEALPVDAVALRDEVKAKYRDVDETDAEGMCALREPASAYTGSFAPENGALRAKNAVFWR